MTKQFTFGGKQRLKSRKLIDQLFSKGQRMGLFPYRVFYLFEKIDGTGDGIKLQCGIGVTTRNFKKAADRNRIKRLTREGWRLQKTVLDQKMTAHPQKLLLFLIYTGTELPEFMLVKEKLGLIIEKLIKIADESIAENT